MALSTWIVVGESVAAETCANIVALLERSGIRTHPLHEGESRGPGLAVFTEVDDKLLSLLRSEGQSAAVLALSVSRHALPSQTLWSLVQAGARDVLQWPTLPESAEDIACRMQRWVRVDELLDSRQVSGSLVGTSRPWRRVLRGIVEMSVFTSSSILISGESGTGKELIAHLIHDLDPRRDKGDLVVVDCTTLSPELSGSEFFGHERGAFTGAMTARDGAFALADKGTLFLDEVGELNPELQAQLLRVAQEHKFKRVGGNTWHATDLRILAATNRDLELDVAEGRFRADLYYRIAGWQCRTVPLRERKDDILPLVQHFISKLLPLRSNVVLENAVRDFLVTRDYPGNVRDLQQQVTRICHRHAGSGPISIGDIPPEDHAAGNAAQVTWPENSFRSAVGAAVALGIGMKDIGHTAVELAIEMALEYEEGNVQRAAARLGVTDRALQKRASQRSVN